MISLSTEEIIAIIKDHKKHWQRLLRDKICDETEGRETIESFDRAISALELELEEKEEESAPFDFELFQAGLMDIPDGMTNGEVLKSIFPTAELILGNSDYMPDVLSVKEEWWNAPYKKRGE